MIETLTAAAIAKLAFDGVIQASAGKLTEAALEKKQTALAEDSRQG